MGSQITVYSLKSSRKNAKSTYKTLRIYSRGDNPRRTYHNKYTLCNLYDAVDFLETAPYTISKIIAYREDGFTYISPECHSIETAINCVFWAMTILGATEELNQKALQDIHLDQNIRYHINRRYKNKVVPREREGQRENIRH